MMASWMMDNIKYIYLDGQAFVHSELQGKDYLVKGQFYCEVSDHGKLLVKDFHANDPEDGYTDYD